MATVCAGLKTIAFQSRTTHSQTVVAHFKADTVAAGNHAELSEEIDIDRFDKMVSEVVSSKLLEQDGFSVFIYGQGCKPRSFYHELKYNPDVELFWTGFSGPKTLWFLSFIPGQAGLLKVNNLAKTQELYNEVGGLSFCSLFFFPTDKEEELINGIRKNHLKFSTKDWLKDVDSYFILDTDFDFHGGDRDGEIYYRFLRYGTGLNEELKEILTRIE